MIMLHAQIEGKGKPLVLIHAFPLSSDMWKAQAGILKNKYTIILPDLPGFGKSQPQVKPSIPDMAKQLAQLLDHLQIKEPVIVGGLSMGGYVAFEFFRQFPERLKGLLLFATRANPDSPEARENRFRAIEAIEKFGLETFVKKIIKSQLGKTTQEKHPEVMEQAVKIMLSNTPEAAIHALRAMAERRDSSELPPQIKVPVLVLAGEEDTICPAAEMRGMQEKISNSEFHAVSQSGHLINLEKPEVFQSLVDNYLKKHF